jgi:hypothetical protein
MSKIKHYDTTSKTWVIDGASNADNIELSNPGFVNELGNSISVDSGFTKVDNRLTKLEHNLAWVYLNGAKGGGGSGGGTTTTYTLTVSNGSTVYTTSNSVDLTVMISGGSSSKTFTVALYNYDTNKLLKTYSVVSKKEQTITVTDISGTTKYMLQAYDSSNNTTDAVYVTIVAGAISLKLTTAPSNVMYIGSSTAINAIFTLTNNIGQDASTFILTCTVGTTTVELVNDKTITETSRQLSYNIRSLIANNDTLSSALTAGRKYSFSAYASTTLDGKTLTTSTITFSITAADSNNLVIVTDNISESNSSWDSITSFSKGTPISFNYYLSYANVKYSTFDITYTISSVASDSTETVVTTNTISKVSKNSSILVFSYPTTQLTVNSASTYYKITLYGCASDNTTDTSAQYTKIVYCKVAEATSVTLTANNYNNRLLLYYSPIIGFPQQGASTWTYYPNKAVKPYAYNGIHSFPNGITLTLFKTNGTDTGFIPDSDGTNKIPAIILNGHSYATIDAFKDLFPAEELSTGNSLFTTGFNLSVTFKTDADSSDTDTVLSFGTYKDSILYSGFEITASKATIAMNSAGSTSLIMPKNKIVTVDLNVKFEDITTDTTKGTITRYCYMLLYLNGVMSRCLRVAVGTVTKDINNNSSVTWNSTIDWKWAQELYLGCRNSSGTLSNFSYSYIYDFKIYDAFQSEYTLIRNYISAYEQANLSNGVIDSNIHNTLCSKNLIASDGTCAIFDSTNDVYYTGSELYTKLISLRTEGNLPYDIVLITETSTSGSDFEQYTRALWGDSANKEDILSKTWPCKIDYLNTVGKSCTIQKVTGSYGDGPTIALEGTSSLSYNSKNFELNYGYASTDNSTPMLFMPTDDWLPENEHTLKADVVDSGHVNNVLIGKVINGECGYNVFNNTPPMSLGESEYASTSDYIKIHDKLRHTSDGFPVLLFIKFADQTDGTIGSTKFMGIYNFNLGRAAYHNLGLKFLTSYTKDTTDGPSTVSTYTENVNRYNLTDSTANGTNNGTYSFEVEDNDSSVYQKAFGQDDLSIVKVMLGGKPKYSSRDSEIAFNKIHELYSQLANMVPQNSTIAKYKTTDNGTTYTATGESYTYNSSLYNYSTFEQYCDLHNTCSYFVLAIIFGMVDSMCKNMTLRNWGSKIWYPSFYDMDTAFKLNNSAQEQVAYYAHLHYFYNVTNSSGVTEQATKKFFKETDDNNQPITINGKIIKQYFASYWTRLWEVIDDAGLPAIDGQNATSKDSIQSVYQAIRTNLIPDPDAFIETYYRGYVEQCGGILYNYDYKIKYLNLSEKYDATNGYSYTSDDQTSFLYGTRVETVKEWFKKRIYFLDSVYGVGNSISIESPMNSSWQNNKVKAKSSGIIGITLKATSKMDFYYSYGTGNTGTFWIDEDETTGLVPTPTGEIVALFRPAHYITEFGNFNSYLWTSLPNIDFPQITELDLSGQSSIYVGSFFVATDGGVYNSKGTGLKNIKKLNLSNVILTTDSTNPASSFTLDCSACTKLEELNLSKSSITNFNLPSTNILRVLNLSGTSITSLNLSNQALLETLDITNCNSLTTINISNCSSLTSINIPASVTSITFSNCAGLTQIVDTFSSVTTISSLTTVTATECPGLKLVNLSGQNNPNLVITLTGASNLEELYISRTNYSSLILPQQSSWISLKKLDISYTSISSLVYNYDTSGTNPNVDYLDLSGFADLNYLYASNCKQLNKVVCPNTESNPIELPAQAFKDCLALTTLYGHFSIEGSEVFRNCSALKINGSSLYDGNGSFINNTSATNISFNSTLSTLYFEFENCTGFTGDDFKYIMLRLPSSITSMEGTFSGCSGIDIDVWYDLFKNLSKVTSLKGTFNGTNLKGILRSRLSTYSATDKTTWGFFDFLPVVSDVSNAFTGTKLNWIDNNIFAPIGTTYSSITLADGMFSNCSDLYSATDTTASTIVVGTLSSKTFFTNLRNLASIYPKNMFSGCSHVVMTIDSDDNNTYLFHTANSNFANTTYQLDSSIYTGVSLTGTINNNVFGGVNRVISDGTNTYYIPIFTAISFPFRNNSGVINMTFANMGNCLQIKDTSNKYRLLQAIGPFSGCTVSTTDTIPTNIFRNLVNLNSISYFFSGITGLTASDYSFPALDTDGNSMFNDNVLLNDISYLFFNDHDMNIKLIGERFTNCVLSNVSYAFYGSGVYGTIPYRLFFMKNQVVDSTTNRYKVGQTIENMAYVFGQCWKLGYTKDRTILTGTYLEDYKRNTDWSDHIIGTAGTRVYYKLDVSNMQKSYNYDYYVPTASTTTTTTSSVDNSSNTTTKTTTVETTIDGKINTTIHTVVTNSSGTTTSDETKTTTTYNSLYNPGDTAFDVWYLDGFGWDNAITTDTSTDDTSLANVKARLTTNYRTYFTDDAAQKAALATLDPNSQYSEWGIQNYAIPTDLFRYCSADCTLEYALADLNYKVNILAYDSSTGKYSVDNNNSKGYIYLDTDEKFKSYYDGVFGRVPAKLFESLVKNKSLIGVFRNTRFCAYINLLVNTDYSTIRGYKYPLDMLDYNSYLEDASYMFTKTVIETGVDINPILFNNCLNLKNISHMWADCIFHNQDYVSGTATKYSNFKFEDSTSPQIFSNNKYITNGSGLFSFNVSGTTGGLLIITDTFLSIANKISDISSMFQGDTLLKGSVPLFNISSYPLSRNSCSNYLTGVVESNITNASSIVADTTIKPFDWT